MIWDSSIELHLLWGDLFCPQFTPCDKNYKDSSSLQASWHLWMPQLICSNFMGPLRWACSSPQALLLSHPRNLLLWIPKAWVSQPGDLPLHRKGGEPQLCTQTRDCGGRARKLS
jgi:hypothetical protein